jgi:hypothetical protein
MLLCVVTHNDLSKSNNTYIDIFSNIHFICLLKPALHFDFSLFFHPYASATSLTQTPKKRWPLRYLGTRPCMGELPIYHVVREPADLSCSARLSLAPIIGCSASASLPSYQMKQIKYGIFNFCVS